ncbi:unnamed protein product [Paramecium pentaurelia]|uniref:G domain-containing protein n=1 Tax=Paramecium pentaurelia TaxID=43138 RepID=A0A8S1X270_9CILI|nr:unnamed protein product [Paramecium pentaurelia]
MDDEEKKINMILEVIDFLNGMLQKINENIEKKKKTILLIGNTGSGKSTIFNFLSGAKFDFQNKQIILIEEKGKKFSKQGDSMKSITFEPNFNMIENDYILIDFPGFKDTNGTKNQLSIQLMFNEIVTSTEVILAVVIQQPCVKLIERGQTIQEIVQDAFTSQYSKINSIGLIVNRFDDRLEDEPATKYMKQQLQDKGQDAKENGFIYKALSENIMIIREIDPVKQIFTDEKKETLIKQLQSIKPVSFQPDKVDQDNIVSDYIEAKLNRLFIEYEGSLIKNRDEAKKKGEIKQFQTTLNDKLKEIDQFKHDDLNLVIEWMKKTILSVISEEIDNFLKIFKFFFKYKANIFGFKKLNTHIEGLKAKIQSIVQEIQADIQRIDDEQKKLNEQIEQQQRKHREYLKQLDDDLKEYKRQKREELKQKQEDERKIQENKKAEIAKQKQKQEEEQAKQQAIREELKKQKEIQEEKQKQLKLAEEKKQSEKKNLIKKLTTSENSISKLKADKQKYIKEQEGIYMKAWGGDWSSDYNKKISNYDKQIETEVNNKDKILQDLLKY